MNADCIPLPLLSPPVLREIAAFRYDIFVRKLGWPLNCAIDHELDEFDTPASHHITLRCKENHLLGYARLLPSTGPHLLSDIFSELLDGPLPCNAHIWELSRFAATSGASEASAAHKQFSSPHAVALLSHTLQLANRLGIRQLVTVSPVGVDRLLRCAGFKARALSPPRWLGGHRLFACQIDCLAAQPSPVRALQTRSARELHLL